MTPPRYRPTCNYRACRNQKTGETAAATTYVVGAHAEPLYVCGSCARKIAVKLGIDPDPELKKKKPARKPRPVS